MRRCLLVALALLLLPPAGSAARPDGWAPAGPAAVLASLRRALDRLAGPELRAAFHVRRSRFHVNLPPGWPADRAFPLVLR